MKKQNNYFFEIIILPIIVIIFLVVSITTYNIQITKKQIENQISNKKIEFLEKQKKLVYNKVQFINSSIKIESSKIEADLKRKLKEKIEMAIKIADDLQKENHNLSKKIISQVLSKRLSFLQYNKNRGYFFVLDRSNKFIHHPIKRYIGQDMSSFVDKDNKLLVKNLRNRAKDSKIGFEKYYFYKPGDNKKQHLKLTAVTYYKPLDILIGTGEYIDVVAQEFKENFIEKLKANHDLDKYIFILEAHNLNGGDKFSTTLLNNNKKDTVGKMLDDNVPDFKGNFYRKNYLKLLREEGEGFVKYWYKKPKTNESKQKLTYFYYNKEWKWIIASGFYIEDLENEIEKLKTELDIYLSNLIENSIFWGSIFSFVTIILSTAVFYRIQRRISSEKEKLVNSEENLNKAQKISHIGSWNFDIASKEITWSDEIYHILETPKDKYKPSYELFLSFIFKEDRERIKNIFENTLVKKVSHNFVHKLKVKNKIKWVVNQSDIFYNKSKDSYMMVGILQDITEKYEKDKKIEEQSQLLFNQSKMAAMGEMIENIAHQWRQPLSAISISASGLKLENELGMLNTNKIDTGLGDIINNTKYLSNTIEDFRKYFIQDKIKKVCNLKLVYENCMKLLKPKFKNLDIKLVEDFEDLECEILENELLQCLMNIFNNAHDALIKKEVQEKLIYIKIYKEYENAVISIKDNAGGVDENFIQKIFEPYFTTKHKSQGTGIGLYMTQEIITKHLNGYIKVINEEYKYGSKKYKGANFKISIPLGDLEL